MSEPITLTAYAKRRGVSVASVSKAVTSGRLSSSVVRDESGAPKIGDVQLADREWTANTRPRIDHPPATPSDTRSGSPVRTGPNEIPDYNESRALREAAAARREAALADMAELDRDERKGELVSVDEARADVIDKFAIVRTRLLGVPSRVAQRMPHLAAEVVPIVDDLVREALEELSTGDG